VACPSLSPIIPQMRMHRELTRIVKGLYFHHTRRALPATFKVFTVTEPLLDYPIVAEIVEKLQREPWNEIGRGEFAYKYQIIGVGESEGSVWLFLFYGVVPFLMLLSQGGNDSENEWDPEFLKSLEGRIWGLPEPLSGSTLA
jgi:hypothetical protein